MEIDTTRNYADLPSEILAQIFKQVPRQSQVVCLYICKSWHHTAKQLLYATVITGTKNIQKLIHCVEQTSAGMFVKLLQINEHIGMEREQLIRLINACYNLQELQIINHASLFKWIKESDEINLNKLRVITPLGRSSWRLTKQNNLFYLVAHKFRNSIESLHIPCTSTDNNEIKSTMEYLSSFHKLKNLALIDGNMSDVVYFDDLLSICPSLEILNMQLGHPLFDKDNNNKRSANHCTTTYPTLHTLDFYLSNFSVDYIRYIINRFINMRSLTLRINQMNSDWRRDQNKIEQFLKLEYIPYIKKLQNSCLSIKMNVHSFIGDFFSNFTIMDKHAKVDAHFCIENSRSERTDICIETQQQRNVSARYTFVKDFSFSPTELPYTKHLITYGSHISKLYIHLPCKTGKGIDFGFISSQCGNTEQIEIDIAHAQPREYRWCSLLEMYNGIPNTYWIMESECSKNNCLSALKISGGMITDTLLYNTSYYAPNLKKLSLMSCSFDDSSTFDMSNLNLKEFELDTCMFYNIDRQYTHVIITSKEEKQSNYYVFDKSQRYQFEHVSFTQFNNRCATLKEMDEPCVVLEFIFNTIESMRLYVGKYPKEQIVENIFFFYPEIFSFRSIK